MSQAAEPDITEITATTDTPGAARYTLWQLVRCMLRLGPWGFGGPVALVASCPSSMAASCRSTTGSMTGSSSTPWPSR